MHIPFSLNTAWSVPPPPSLALPPPPSVLLLLPLPPHPPLRPPLSPPPPPNSFKSSFSPGTIPCPSGRHTASDAHTPVEQCDWPRRVDYRSSSVIGPRGRDVQSGTASSLTAPRAAASCAPSEPVSSQFGRREGRRKEREREKKNATSKWSRGRKRETERAL